MLFYAAAGSYQIHHENDRNMPYIMRLGKLHPISIPEFAIWSSLLWEVLSYNEAKRAYQEIMQGGQYPIPEFDALLNKLIARKLVIAGEGYTGLDALYNMLSNTFIVPLHEQRNGRIRAAGRMLFHRKITWKEFFIFLRRNRLNKTQKRIMDLVQQTPLSTAELICCFDRGIRDVTAPDKVIEGIYLREESCQATLPNEEYPSRYMVEVLNAIASLYLGHRIILERA